MSETHLSHDEFFEKLSSLFDVRRQKDHGSIYLTQKRMTYGQNVDTDAPITTSIADQLADLHPSKPIPIIIRATDGKTGEGRSKRKERVKLSTVVESDALDGFFLRYAEVCKLGMSQLKKKDRAKAKQKLKAAKKKKQAGAVGSTDAVFKKE